ncbi:MAG: acyl-CoA dehydrogenase [Bacteroidetes bacterium]|nr:MAG: acyl-CoA dehydrogenase [Bacteroidota bacterium]TAG89786.1 MAG: acyl-CoA dehydrogenase [Bacteroidota bacterium]
MEKYISLQNLQFLLYDVHQAHLLTKNTIFSSHTQEDFDLMLSSALEMGDKLMRPYNRDMDANEPQLVNGKIIVHEKVKDFIKACGEGGWISAGFSEKDGGMQLPAIINNACGYIFNAANYSMSVFPFLTAGAANLINTFANESLKKIYLPKMFSGEWQGTMALTEPDAGSSLSDIITTATPSENGTYQIKGQKIYISAGDHNACDNIVHLMLARIKGAPAGVKGISLFIVPQKRMTNDNQLENNDVITAGIFHKMGYKGAPIAHLSIGSNDNCVGYLVGEEHKGLSYMFQMMNEARIGVGMNAVGIASAAYYDSLKYAKERPQGRKIENKDIAQKQVNIIEHADVKRMLLFQKSIIDGSLGLLLQCALYADKEKTATKPEEKEKFALLLDFLTPVAKSYPSEMGILTTSTAVQILGGAGYCRDFNVEQYFRESRIHPIHEGTTGIHGIDLLGRKVNLKNGKAFKYFLRELYDTVNEAENIELLQMQVGEFSRNVYIFASITKDLQEKIEKYDIEKALSDATLYLELVGILAVGWQLLKQFIAVQNHKDINFKQGKIFSFHYFCEYELPKIQLLRNRLEKNDFLSVKMKEDYFV